MSPQRLRWAAGGAIDFRATTEEVNPVKIVIRKVEALRLTACMCCQIP
jgi:hypothetical protein